MENTNDAVMALRAAIDEHRLPVHFPIEIRFCKADDVPLSPSFGRDSCFIGTNLFLFPLVSCILPVLLPVSVSECLTMHMLSQE